MPEVTLGDKRFWYRRGGEPPVPDAETLVFLHGAGGSSLTWLYQLRALRRSYHCIAPDLPGHGKSDDHASDTAGDLAERVIALLDGLELTRVHLIGHSIGAAVALEIAASAPERCASLALFSCGLRLPVSDLLIDTLHGSLSLWTSLMEDLLYSPSTPRRFVDKTTTSGLQSTREVALRDFQICSSFDFSKRAHLLPQPAVVIVGRDDALSPVPLAETLAHSLEAQFEVIDEAGHMAMLEQHKRVNEILSDFYRKLRT